LLPQRSKHPREMVITPKVSTSNFVGGPNYAFKRGLIRGEKVEPDRDCARVVSRAAL